MEVWAVTDHPAAGVCPECATPARRVHEYVLAWPRDVRRGPDRVDLCWVKRHWKCDERTCARKMFTEWLPQVPPRCRLTRRLREQAAAEVAERGITPAEAARHAGVSWPVAHEAFAATADPVLEQRPAPVAHLGIDEHRRGRPRWRTDEQTGEYELLADRWHSATMMKPVLGHYLALVACRSRQNTRSPVRRMPARRRMPVAAARGACGRGLGSPGPARRSPMASGLSLTLRRRWPQGGTNHGGQG